jgi:flagellar biosynthesis GTPase FlhF
MSGIEDSFRDTISYMNENISDAMRGIKSSLNSTVNGIPFPAIGLSIFTITVLGVMVSNSNGNPESIQEEPQEVSEEEPSVSDEPEVSEEAMPMDPSEEPSNMENVSNAYNDEPPNEQPMDEQPPNEQPMDEQPPNEQPMDEQPPNEQTLDEQPPNEQPMDEQPQTQEQRPVGGKNKSRKKRK